MNMRVSRRRSDGLRSSDRATCLAARGFTLVEMVVVLAIVLILLSLALPAASRLWSDRKVADARNTVEGLLMTARAGAMKADGGDAGLLFVVDAQGAQRVFTIVQDAGVNTADPALHNVFRIAPSRDMALPVPMRAVPRYAVNQDRAGTADDPYVFNQDELADNTFSAIVPGGNQSQRHRNYFALIFSGSGQLRVGRDVLIQDEDEDADWFGDRTGVRLVEDEAGALLYYKEEVAEPIDPADPTRKIERLIATNTGVAINFRSVDGLLVYDDALFNGFATGRQKRDYLLRDAQPYFIARLTGRVIRGPVGESVAPKGWIP